MNTCYLLYTDPLKQSKSRTTQVGPSCVTDKTFPIFHIPTSRAHNSHLKIRNKLGHNWSRITFPKISCNSNNDNLDSSLVSIHITRYTSASFYIKIPGLPILCRNFLQFTSMPSVPSKQSYFEKSHSKHINCTNITSSLLQIRPVSRCWFSKGRFFFLPG